MASKRNTQTSSKLNDFVTGDEIDNIIESSNDEMECKPFETPLNHPQINGKINNVTFRTLPSRISIWKTSVINFFGQKRTAYQKGGSVIKVVCDIGSDTNCTIKINFYQTGSVVIQGAKCARFSELFFPKLKLLTTIETDNINIANEVQNSAAGGQTTTDEDSEDGEQTIIPESEKPDAAHQNELSDSSITYQKDFATPNMVTSTPSTPIKLPKPDLSPQERVIQHSQSLNVKLETINSSMSSIEDSLKSCCLTI